MSRPTQDTYSSFFRSLKACHLLRVGFPTQFSLQIMTITRSYNPGSRRFGLLPFRSPLLREYRLISFPLVT